MLKRTVSLRQFFWVPTIFWLRNKKNIFQFRTLIWSPVICAGWYASLLFTGLKLFLFSLQLVSQFYEQNKVYTRECRGSFVRMLDWESKDCWFETHCQRSHCVVSLSKTLYPLHSTGSNPGRREIVLTYLKNCWLGCKAAKQNKI